MTWKWLKEKRLVQKLYYTCLKKQKENVYVNELWDVAGRLSLEQHHQNTKKTEKTKLIDTNCTYFTPKATF